MSDSKRDRGYLRAMARRKIHHRRYICTQVYGFEWYRHMNQYSKNKIHCSCPMCRFGVFDAGKNTSNMRQRSFSTRRRYESQLYKIKDWEQHDSIQDC